MPGNHNSAAASKDAVRRSESFRKAESSCDVGDLAQGCQPLDDAKLVEKLSTRLLSVEMPEPAAEAPVSSRTRLRHLQRWRVLTRALSINKLPESDSPPEHPAGTSVLQGGNSSVGRQLTHVCRGLVHFGSCHIFAAHDLKSYGDVLSSKAEINCCFVGSSARPRPPTPGTRPYTGLSHPRCRQLLEGVVRHTCCERRSSR